VPGEGERERTEKKQTMLEEKAPKNVLSHGKGEQDAAAVAAVEVAAMEVAAMEEVETDAEEAEEEEAEMEEKEMEEGEVEEEAMEYREFEEELAMVKALVNSARETGALADVVQEGHADDGIGSRVVRRLHFGRDLPSLTPSPSLYSPGLSLSPSPPSPPPLSPFPSSVLPPPRALLRVRACVHAHAYI